MVVGVIRGWVVHDVPFVVVCRIASCCRCLHAVASFLARPGCRLGHQPRLSTRAQFSISVANLRGVAATCGARDSDTYARRVCATGSCVHSSWRSRPAERRTDLPPHPTYRSEACAKERFLSRVSTVWSASSPGPLPTAASDASRGWHNAADAGKAPRRGFARVGVGVLSNASRIRVGVCEMTASGQHCAR